MGLELTYEEIHKHNTKNDAYIVLHNKIYDVSSFIDDHPGGVEVLLDVFGQDATEAFEDIGHSDEARERLSEIEIGVLKDPGELGPIKKTSVDSTAAVDDSSSSGVGSSYLMLFVAMLSYAAWRFV